jgi:hypothetical protein
MYLTPNELKQLYARPNPWLARYAAQKQDEKEKLKELILNKTCDMALATGTKWEDVPTLTPYRAFKLSRFLSVQRPRCVDSKGNPSPRYTQRTHPVTTTCIEELGGKVRVASMHPSYLSHFSRNYAQKTLPLLKSFGVFRRTLLGQNLKLTGRPGAKLYSADLTAASDMISHELGQAVLGAIGEGFGEDLTTLDALRACAEPYQIWDQGEPTRTKTRSGLHMGLGTTWTVLCILNLWAASRISPPGKSFAICGDDLIGLWNDQEIKSYNSMIKVLGLLPNEPKSFIGRNGVFCEQLVRIVHRDTEGTYAKSEQLIRISEASGARGDVTVETREKLSGYLKENKVLRPIRQLILRTLRLTTPRGVGNGPVAAGGNGCLNNISKAASLLGAYLQKGPAKVGRRTAEDVRIVMTNIQSQLTNQHRPKHTIELKEVLLPVMRSVRAKEVINGESGSRPEVDRFGKMRQRIFKQRTKSTYTKKELLDLLSTSPHLTSRVRRDCKRIVIRSPRILPGRIPAVLLHKVTASPPLKYLNLSTALSVYLDQEVTMNQAGNQKLPGWATGVIPHD